MIIDSHLHLPALREGITLADSRKELVQELEKNDVSYAILIPDNMPVSEIGSLDEVRGLVERDKNLFVMGTIDIQRDREPHIRKLDLLFRTRRIVAVKIFPGHDPIYPTDKRLVPVCDLCVKYDLPIVIHTGANSRNPEPAKYNDPKHIVKVARRFPKMKSVIAHYFWPKVEYCHELTKPYANIHFDTSGLADDEVIEETGLDKIKKVLTLTARAIIGWIKAGRDAGSKRLTTLETVKNDPTVYDIVVIGTPIWRHTMSTPVRTYISQYKGSLRRIAFFCTGRGAEDSPFDEMESLCGKKTVATLRLQRRRGVESGHDSEKIEDFVSKIKA